MSSVLNCTGHDLKCPNVVDSDGPYLFDDKGKRYLDLESGVWCVRSGTRTSRSTLRWSDKPMLSPTPVFAIQMISSRRLPAPCSRLSASRRAVARSCPPAARSLSSLGRFADTSQKGRPHFVCMTPISAPTVLPMIGSMAGMNFDCANVRLVPTNRIADPTVQS